MLNSSLLEEIAKNSRVYQSFSLCQIASMCNELDEVIWEKSSGVKYLYAVIGASGDASLGISSIDLPDLIISEAKSIISAVPGRVALYSLSLTGACQRRITAYIMPF